MVVLFSSFVVLFVGGLYYRTLLAGAVVLTPAAIFVYLDLRRNVPRYIPNWLNQYQWGRIETFLRPVEGSDAYRQVQQSLFSIGSGGLYGKGFLNNGYVANGYNDFVFSITAEQFGFAGCAAVLGLMAFILVKCALKAFRSNDLQGRMIAAGVAGMLLFETFVNVAVVTELMPNTGMPFPFLSYGGSSIWVHMAAIGFVISVGMPRERPMFEALEGS
jgi:rod shape determining protein RodA